MIAVWKDVKGYEGLYKVSNQGEVCGVDRRVKKGDKSIFVTGVILKPFENKSGYLTVRLSKNGKMKTFYVHDLVIKNFIYDKPKGMTVNHKNEDKRDNSVKNLEYMTQRENNIHGTKIQRTSNKKFKKRVKFDLKTGEVIKVYKTIEELLQDGYKLLNTKMCCIKVNKSAYGYGWRYLDE